MKKINKRLTELISSFFNRETKRVEMNEFSDLLGQTDDDVVFDVLTNQFENYEPDFELFKDRQEKLKLKIDNEINLFQPKQIDFKRTIKILWRVAVVLVLSFSTFYAYRLSFGSDKAEKNISIVTLPGERATIELPDGSKVLLNSSSKLSYSSNFNQQNRLVRLEGEAFFDIQKSKTDKFIVKTKHHSIEVMGTTFNVLSYPDEQHYELTLLTGKVKVNSVDDPSNTIILKPNEKYEVDLISKKRSVSSSDTDIETAWLRGELVMKDIPLKQALARIERFYGVSIEHQSIAKIENGIFTGRFKKGNVEDVLKVLSIVYPVKYTLRNQDITISLR